MKVKIVFDDLPAVGARLLGPAAEYLTYALTFEAASMEEANRIAAEVTEELPALGRYHVEEVPTEPVRGRTI
jgi:hypothetical protein